MPQGWPGRLSDWMTVGSAHYNVDLLGKKRIHSLHFPKENGDHGSRGVELYQQGVVEPSRQSNQNKVAR